MRTYRLYFLDERGAILLRKDFEATDDRQALQIGHLAAQIFSLTCCGFALWQGKRQLWEGRPDVANTKAGAVERLALDTEETLHSSRWRLAFSQKLLAKLALPKDNRPMPGNGTDAA